MPSILSLPFELLLKTAELLLPTDTALTDDNVEDPRDIAANVKRVNNALDDVRNLTLTCRQLGSLTIKLSRGLRLVGGARQNRFIQDMDDVSSKVYSRNTRYVVDDKAPVIRLIDPTRQVPIAGTTSDLRFLWLSTLPRLS